MFNLTRKLLSFFVTILILVFIFNLTSLNFPSDAKRYAVLTSYLRETSQATALPEYQFNYIGMGMTSYNNEIRLLNDPQLAYNELLMAIYGAEETINMEEFIVRDDQAGQTLQKLLIEKAQSGVKVKLIYDAWGSAFTSNSYFDALRSGGVYVAVYNPLFASFWQGRLFNRLHRKITIIDGQKAFICGENIGDEYLGADYKLGPWRDNSAIYTGGAAQSLQQVFLSDWLYSTGEFIINENYFPLPARPSNQSVTIILGSPDSYLTNMSSAYSNLANLAENSIYIMTPYFTPNKTLSEALYNAASRNVDVHVLMSEKCDSRLYALIRPYYIDKMIKHGVKVSLYKGGFIHSKVMIIDDKAASIGTANMDKLSFTRNYEVNSIINDPQSIQTLQQECDQYLVDSIPARQHQLPE